MQKKSESASRTLPRFLSRAAGAATVLLAGLAPSFTENAVANGETRTINLFHAHTKESISATYLINGQYDQAVLRQLNWFLRDWRRDEPTNMDPRLFDVVWETYRSAGAGTEVINVVSAYRSPETNAMLRRRSRAVAKYSQHMLGKAMDTTMPGMPMSRIREIGMRMQRGGVGYYPTAGTPFVHLDVGNVRHWPRMSYDQLAQLFPDGKTVHLPSNGQPLARYEEAKAEIEARNNGAYVTAPRRGGGLFAWLFGGGEEDEDAGVAAPPEPVAPRKQWASLAPRHGKAERMAAAETDEEGGAPAPAEQRSAPERSEALARAEANLPRGETVLSAPPTDQEPEKPARPEKAVHVPLPPTRPASLARLVVAEAPALAEAQQLDRSGAVAFLETGPALRGTDPAEAPPQQAGAPAEEKEAPAFVAPLPPRRPLGLGFAQMEAPLPPIRPAMTPTAAAKASEPAAHAIATLMEAPTKTAARSAGQAVGRPDAEAAALAYAPAPPSRPQSGGKGVFVPARLDRSNFHALTATTPASRASGASVNGSAIGAMRSAARAAQPGVLTPLRAAASSAFAHRASEPPSDKFAPGR